MYLIPDYLKLRLIKFNIKLAYYSLLHFIPLVANNEPLKIF